jgi:hypothetical protein
MFITIISLQRPGEILSHVTHSPTKKRRKRSATAHNKYKEKTKLSSPHTHTIKLSMQPNLAPFNAPLKFQIRRLGWHQSNFLHPALFFVILTQRRTRCVFIYSKVSKFCGRSRRNESRRFSLTCVAVRREQRLLQADQIDDDGAENESGEEHHSLEAAVTCGQTRTRI